MTWERRGETSVGGSLQVLTPVAGCSTGRQGDAVAGPRSLLGGRTGWPDPSCARRARVNAPAPRQQGRVGLRSLIRLWGISVAV